MPPAVELDADFDYQFDGARPGYSLTTGEPLGSWPDSWLALVKQAVASDPELEPLLDGEGEGSVMGRTIRARDILGKHTGDPMKVDHVIRQSRLGYLIHPALAVQTSAEDPSFSISWNNISGGRSNIGV